jgi:hypothetical protein
VNIRARVRSGSLTAVSACREAVADTRRKAEPGMEGIDCRPGRETAAPVAVVNNTLAQRFWAARRTRSASGSASPTAPGALFGVAGMALAAMGTYGLVSYTVQRAAASMIGADAMIKARVAGQFVHFPASAGVRASCWPAGSRVSGIAEAHRTFPWVIRPVERDSARISNDA